ncbi:hypothetical protein H0H93_007761 [Arthromyces matolae]|nr:hypothetical protein H0H93_007761 [Arthromyces matolae]
MVAISLHLQIAVAWITAINNKNFTQLSSLAADDFLSVVRPISLGFPNANITEFVERLQVSPVVNYNISLPEVANTIEQNDSLVFYVRSLSTSLASVIVMDLRCVRQTKGNGYTIHGFPWSTEYMQTFLFTDDNLVLSVIEFGDSALIDQVLTSSGKVPADLREDDEVVESGEYEGAAKYLQDMFQVLNDDSNRVRWEEYGVCNDIQTPFNFDAKECEKAGKDRMDLVRKAVLTTVCWRIGTLLRYTYPLRLGEALQPMEVCWELTKFFNLPNILADEADPILQIFLAIAREQNGGSFDYDAETARMLRPEIIEQPQVGPKNHVLALGALARLYRRLGRPNEAHQMFVVISFIIAISTSNRSFRVKRLAEDIDGRKYMLTPYDWLQSIDADTRSRITTYLGHDPFKNIVQISPDAAWDGNLHAIFEVHRKRGLYYEGRPIPDIPLETYKKPLQKRECWNYFSAHISVTNSGPEYILELLQSSTLTVHSQVDNHMGMQRHGCRWVSPLGPSPLNHYSTVYMDIASIVAQSVLASTARVWTFGSKTSDTLRKILKVKPYKCPMLVSFTPSLAKMRHFSKLAALVLLSPFTLAMPVSELEVVKRATALDTSSHCGQWDTVTASPYILYLDQWGISGTTAGSDCASLTSLSGTTIAWKTTWTWAGSGIKSFTNIALNSGLNKQLSAISSIQSTWKWSQSSSGTVVADVAYDLFTSSTSGGSAANEIMIWLANYNAGPISATYSSSGQPSPIASSVSIAGHTWNLYFGSNGSNNVYSFLPTSGTVTSFSGDINLFIKYLTSNQGLSSSQYLTTLEAGTEATSGTSVTLTTPFHAAMGILTTRMLLNVQKAVAQELDVSLIIREMDLEES